MHGSSGVGGVRGGDDAAAAADDDDDGLMLQPTHSFMLTMMMTSENIDLV